MIEPRLLTTLHGALLAALGLSGCTSRPLGDPGVDDSGASAEPDGSSGTPPGSTSAAAPTSGETSAGSPGTTTSAATSAGTTIAGTTSAGTTSAAMTTTSGDTTTTTTTTGDGSTTSDATSGTTSDTTGEPCVELMSLGTDLMPADVIQFPGCEASMASECYDYIKICAPRPDDAATCEACGDSCLGEFPPLCWYAELRGAECGPFAEGEMCCSVYEYGWNCGDGRPFNVDGETRIAAVVAGETWGGLARPTLLAELSAAQRAALAELWLADGLAEHASVAAFARFTLQLLSLGAPPELVAAACRAQLDEVGHARVTLGLAAAYGCRVDPGSLAIAGALGGSASREEVLVSTLIEGCVGETIAAAGLAAAAIGCADATVAGLLRGLAADEQRHAALAWRTVQWLVRTGGAALRGAVTAALDRVHVAAPAADTLPAELLLRHGRLPADERVALARQCLSMVIRPCAAALLGDVARASVSA